MHVASTTAAPPPYQPPQKQYNFILRIIGHLPQNIRKCVLIVSVIRAIISTAVLTTGIFVKGWNFGNIYAFVWMSEIAGTKDAIHMSEDTTKEPGRPKSMLFWQIILTWFHFMLLINNGRQVETCNKFSDLQKQQISACFSDIAQGTMDLKDVVWCISMIQNIDGSALPSGVCPFTIGLDRSLDALQIVTESLFILFCVLFFYLLYKLLTIDEKEYIRHHEKGAEHTPHDPHITPVRTAWTQLT